METSVFARKMDIPVSFLLGLAAKEGSWGTSRFAREGNNFLGLHSKPPSELPPGTPMPMVAAGKPRVYMMRFSSYSDCLNYFYSTYGRNLYGINNPYYFADKLQQTGHFGYKDNKIDPNYKKELSDTINGLRIYIYNYEKENE